MDTLVSKNNSIKCYFCNTPLSFVGYLTNKSFYRCQQCRYEYVYSEKELVKYHAKTEVNGVLYILTIDLTNKSSCLVKYDSISPSTTITQLNCSMIISPDKLGDKIKSILLFL